MNTNYEKLQSAINLNPTKQSQTMSIADLSSKIENGTITIPLYQRGISWSVDKAIALFNYELFGKAPVAPISLNKIVVNNNVPQLSFISRNVIELDNREMLSVVDGQQRLTTNYKAYSNDASFKGIVLDLVQGKFKKATKETPNKVQIPVGVLLYKDQQMLTNYVYDNFENDANEIFPLVTGIRIKLLNYNYTIHIADDMTENEQIEWFEVLNNAGSKVSLIELSLSKLKMHDFDIYKSFIEPYKQLVKEFGFDDLFSPFSSNVSYPIASLNPSYEYLIKNGNHRRNFAPIPSDTKENTFLKLSKKELDDMSSLTLKSLKKSLEFINNNNLNKQIDKMQYVMFLTGYFTFNNSSNDNHLIEWVKNANFSNKSNGERRDMYSSLINGFD